MRLLPRVVTALALPALALASSSASARVWPARPGLNTGTSLESTGAARAPEAEDPEDAGFALRQLPLEHRHDAVDSVAEITPGAAFTDTGVRLRGGAEVNLARFVDGFRVYRLTPPGAFLRRVELLTAGYGVGMADVPEGAVALRTQPPAPGLRVELAAWYDENQHLVLADFPGPPPYISPGRSESRRVVSAAVAGPVLEDRLFLTGVLSHTASAKDGYADSEGILPSTPEATSRALDAGFTARLRLGARHQLEALALGRMNEALNGASLSVQSEAQPVRTALVGMVGLRWSGRLSEAVSAQVMAGTERLHTKLESMFCRAHPDSCEQVTAVLIHFPRRYLHDNSDQLGRGDETRTQLGAGVEIRLGDTERTQHVLRLHSRLETGAFERQATAPGNQVNSFANPGIPESRTTYYTGDPRLGLAEPGWTSVLSNSFHMLLGLEDEVQLWRRLTITPGVGVVTTRIEVAENATLVRNTSPVFHLAVGWDVFGSGKTRVRATGGRRVNPGADGSALGLAISPFAQRCLWDPSTNSYTRNCSSSGGNINRTVGLPCSPSGLRADGSSCVGTPAMASVWEQTLGVRQALGAWAFASLDLVHRRISGLPMALETNRVWNKPEAPTAIVGYRNGRAETITDLSLSTALFRRYAGATATLGAHVGGVRGLLAYTYAQQRIGDYYGDAAAPITYERDDPDDSRQGVRLLGTYDLGGWASLGLVYLFDSGRPDPTLPFIYPAPIPGVRTRRGINPGTDINDPADDTVLPRFPSSHRVNLQARFRPGHWLPLGMDVFVDVINLLDAIDYESPRVQSAGGRWVRVGTELRY